MATPTPERSAGTVPPVCFVVALRSEAAPLIAGLGLEPLSKGLGLEPLPRRLGLERSAHAGPFPVYCGAGTALVVSGVGKVAAAAATLYLFARLGEPADAAWLNVGIAGHRERAVGEGVIAHKVTDAGSGRSWFPPIVFDRPAPTCEVVTVEQVERTYDGDRTYDMEAAGFVAAASRLASAELIQVFKVISDNASSPVERIDGERIRSWIGDRLSEIGVVHDALGDLAAELAQAEPRGEAFAAFVERWHFTTSERHRLRRLMQRLRAVGEGDDPQRWAGLRDAAEVLRAMEQTVEERFLVTPMRRAGRQ